MPAAAGIRDGGFPVIVERFVEIETEYHCDGIVLDGEVAFASVSAYIVPMLQQIGQMGGSITIEEGSPESLVIKDLHRRTVQALGLRSGVTHMELLGTASGFLIGEITCRPAGGGLPELVRLQHGVDLWQAFTDISLGREPRLAPESHDRRVVVVDLPIRAGRVTAIST
jgi:biotin carboxylase